MSYTTQQAADVIALNLYRFKQDAVSELEAVRAIAEAADLCENLLPLYQQVAIINWPTGPTDEEHKQMLEGAP